MWIDDHCSPVLVKEVRQALRGRLFAFGFTVSLGLAGVLVAVALLEVDQAPGGRFVLPIWVVLVSALLGFVPFHAQQSMRQEDAEGARDMLALSPLGPWRIVLGKLAAALVVAGLIFAAFLPFLVVVALQRGIDTAAVLALIAQLPGATVLVTALGVATGALGANRVGRGLGVVVLASAAFGTFAIEVQAADAILSGRSRVGALAFVAGGGLVSLALTPLLLGFAAAMLARDDREVSRGLRIAWLVLAGATVLATAVVMPRMGASISAIVSCAILAILIGTFVAAVLVTEDERLDLESRRLLGRIRWGPLRLARGLLASGGGRGVALALMLGLLVTASALVGVVQRAGTSSMGSSSSAFLVSMPPSMGELFFESAFVLATAIGASLAFAVLPWHVLGRSQTRSGTRRIVRWCSAISLLGLSIVVPSILLVSSRGRFDEDALFFSPLFVLMEAAHDVDDWHDTPGGALIGWFFVGLWAHCIAAWSLVRGVREILACKSPRDDVS